MQSAAHIAIMEPDSVSGNVKLAADEAHLWTAPDDICLGLDNAQSLLSSDERAAAARFINERGARSFVVGRVLARLALSRHCPVRPQDWIFVPGSYGRPFIAAPEKYRGMHFSISHTEGLVACLTSRTALAAVDVERITPWDDLPFVAPTILSAEEQRCIETLAGDAWVRRFFEYWTLKEAYTKALSVGLACDFSSVSFRIGASCDITAQFADGVGDVASDWLFRRLALGPGWAGAVAVKTGSSRMWRLVHIELTPDMLARALSRVL